MRVGLHVAHGWRITAGTLIWGALCAAAFAQEPDIWITAAAYSEMHIVLPENAPVILREAADLFQRQWLASTSNELEISPFNEGKINVWLGQSAEAAGLLDAAALEGLGPEGCVIQTFTPGRRYSRLGAMKQLIIAGETEQGTRNGVFEFFKRFVGTQWLCEGATAPARLPYTFAEIDFRFAPHFTYREVGRYAPHAELDSEYRRAHHFFGQYAPGPFGAATLHDLLPPERYFSEHPEYYALIGGRRTPSDPDGRPAQLCFSNADAADAALAAIVEMIRAGAQTHDPDLAARRARIARDVEQKTWSIAPMPGGACECAACRALADAQGAPPGPLMDFVNRVAEGLDNTFPGSGYRVHTLLRGPWRTPPASIRPRDNVIVQISTADCDFRHPLTARDSALNAAFVDDLKRWAAATSALYVWDYGANCTDPFAPHPNLHAVQENIRLYDQYEIQGVYMELAELPGAEWAELNALRSYLCAALLWDPDLFLDGLMERFLAAYYGPAAAQVRAYIALCEEAAAPLDRLDPLAPAAWFGVEAAAQADALFQEALALRLSNDQRRRVMLARLPALHVLAERPGEDAVTAATPENPETVFSDSAAMNNALAQFAAITALYGGEQQNASSLNTAAK